MKGRGPDTRRSVLGLVATRLRGPLLAFLCVTAVAAGGYVAIEHWSWFDACYMAVITIGQVGFGEVHALSTAGRSWTMAVIVSGFGVFVYSAATLTALFLAADVRAAIREARRSRVRAKLHDHVVVAGFGRVGRSASAAAVQHGRQCVVIDSDPSREAAVTATGAVFMCGDARDAAILRDAGASRAAAVIATLDDPSNAVVALTARSLAPSLRIVARASDTSWHDRLIRAGASYVVPVYESVGTSLAATALDAQVLGVQPIPGTEMRVEEMEIGQASRAEGADLRDLMQTAEDLHILGLRREATLTRWHEADEPLEAGDVLVVMGNSAALDHVTELVRPGSRVT